MEDTAITKIVLQERARMFFLNAEQGRRNDYNSMVFDLLNVGNIFELCREVEVMVLHQRYFSKESWKKKVWLKGWELENLRQVPRTNKEM